MVLVYALALLGLIALVVLATVGVAVLLGENDRVSDPCDDALDSVSRLQSGAWTAIRELRDLDVDRKRS